VIPGVPDEPDGGAGASAFGPDEERVQVSGLRRLGKVFGTVVAPTTLVTALLYYFGQSHATFYYRQFGVDTSVLGLGTVDYIFRSLDALFVPAVLSALAGLVGLWGRALIRVRLRRAPHRRAASLLIGLLAAAGVLLTTAGIISVFRPTVLREYLLLAPLSLTLGVPLIAYANGLRRPHGEVRPRGTAAVAEWAIVFTLVAIGLFWAAGDYSAAVGTSAARRDIRTLPFKPAAVVYSDRSLSISGPGVTETRCRNPQGAYRYRYDGLKLMLRAADQYLLVPEGWTRTNAVTILLPRTRSVRLEFVPISSLPIRPDRPC
jgi:hypothetical protein